MFIYLKIDQEDTSVKLLPRIIDSDKVSMRRWRCQPINSKNKDDISVEFIENRYGSFDKTSLKTSISLSELDEESLYISINDFLTDFLTNTKDEEDLEQEFDIANGYQIEEDKVPYDPKKIDIIPQSWSVSFIYDLMSEYKKIDIDEAPDFQRRFVWNPEKQSRLIESLMLGIPMPAFYMAETEGKYQVVDGLQRLTTIKNFLDGKFPLKYLEYLNKNQGEKNQEGRYYIPIGKAAREKSTELIEKSKPKKSIDNEYIFRILQTQVNVNLIRESSPFQVKFDVFRRLNEGGKPLNNQEIRNCIANERIRKLIKELAGNVPVNGVEDAYFFRYATDYTVKITRMEPEEYVLRFIGFWFIHIKRDTKFVYNGDMQDFLDETVDKLNKLRDERVFDSIKKDFKQAMENCRYLFGKYAFRKCLPKDLEDKARRLPINKALFTTLSVVTCGIQTAFLQEKVEWETFIHVFAKALQGEEKLQKNLTTGTNDKAVLYNTFSEISSILQDNLNIQILK